MSENPILISNLNDFIFCPASIYFHSLDDDENILIQTADQINGTNAHKHSDLATYSTKKTMLQGIWVYSAEYNVCGKIDVFDCEFGILTERKKKIKNVYDGYVFQLYAQYFSLLEMGYLVKEIRLYSMDDNKVYKVELPSKDPEMFSKFKDVLNKMNAFSFDGFVQENIQKCSSCIYEPLCSFLLLKGSVDTVYRT